MSRSIILQLLHFKKSPNCPLYIEIEASFEIEIKMLIISFNFNFWVLIKYIIFPILERNYFMNDDASMSAV